MGDRLGDGDASSSASSSATAIVGRIVAALIGLAWNLVTFLTVPILVLEDVGVGDAFKRSKDLFKKTWGENVVGQAGLGVVGVLVVASPAIALIAIGAALGTVGLVVLGAIGVIVDRRQPRSWSAALSGIYRTALYRFATTGRCPPTSPAPTSSAAFRPRDERRQLVRRGLRPRLIPARQRERGEHLAREPVEAVDVERRAQREVHLHAARVGVLADPVDHLLATLPVQHVRAHRARAMPAELRLEVFVAATPARGSRCTRSRPGSRPTCSQCWWSTCTLCA